MADSLEDWIYSNADLLSSLRCTFDNYNQTFASIILYDKVLVKIKKTEQWTLTITNHSCCTAFHDLILSKINNEMKISKVISILFEEIHNLPDPETLEWGMSNAENELVHTNSGNKEQYIAAFKSSEIYKQYEEFKDFLHVNGLEYLVTIDEIQSEGLISLIVRSTFFNLSDNELTRLGLTTNSNIEISLIVNDDAKLFYIENILSNIWIMMKYGLIKYEIRIDSKNVTKEGSYFLSSIIKLFFITFLKLADLNQDHLIRHIFWAHWLQTFSIDFNQISKALIGIKNDPKKLLNYEEMKHPLEDQFKFLLNENFLDSDNIFQILYFTIKFYSEKFCQFCCVCGKKVDNNNGKFITCNSELCQFIFEESSNYDIFNELKISPEIADFEINTIKIILKSNNSNNFFEPFPTFYLKDHELRRKAGFIDNVKLGKVKDNPNQENKNISLLEKHFSLVPSISSLQKFENNEMLKKKIISLSPTEEEGNLSLKLLQYIFTTNKNDMISLKGNLSPFPDHKGMKQILIQPPYSKESCNFLKLKKCSGSEIVFHGTSSSSAYSILRNGLVVLSNTHMMKVGAAYGPGIYCTRSFNMAFQFANQYMNYYPSNLKESSEGDNYVSSLKTVFGIECIKDPKLFINTSSDPNGILVAKERSIIALRYLFVMDNNSNLISGKENVDLLKHYYSTLVKLTTNKNDSLNNRITENKKKYYKNISNKNIENSILFHKKIENQEKEKLSNFIKKEGIGQGHFQRFLDDFTLLYNSKELSVKALKFDKSNFLIWKLIIDCKNCQLFDKFNLNSDKIEKDLYTIFKMKIEIQFSPNYPKVPPFIRLISPRINYHPGIMGIGGCFCCKELTNTYWLETMNLEQLLVFLISNLCNYFKGVDPILGKIKYSREEAKQSFNRISILNGWKKLDDS